MARNRFPSLLLCLAFALPWTVTTPAAGEARRLVARGPFGAVATGHPQATRAALHLLERGGNAIDAAVAAGFALGVADLTNSGLGGDGFALVRLPDGSVHAWDGSSPQPRAAPLATHPIGLPVAPAFLITLHETYGSRGLPEVMRPAIRLAREGFACSGYLARILAGVSFKRGEHPAMDLFYPDGRPLAEGEVLRQPRLADTLTRLARDHGDSFYRGADAERLARDLQTRGSPYSAADLASYRPRRRVPVHRRLGEWTVVGTPPPSSALVVMHLLADFLAREGDPLAPVNLSGAVDACAHAIRLKEGLLARCQRNPALFGLLAPRHPGAGRPLPLPRETVAVGLSPEAEPSPETTHLVVWDRQGMIVTMTLTLGSHGGTGEFSPLGFFYSNESRNFEPFVARYPPDYPPDAGPVSAKAPLLILDGRGEPLLAIGGAGGNRIILNLALVLARFFRQPAGLDRALQAPRIAVDGKGRIRIENHPGVDRMREALKAWSVVGTAPAGDDFFGLVSAVRKASGTLEAVADFRRDGSAGALARDPLAPRDWRLEAFVWQRSGVREVGVAEGHFPPRQTVRGWVTSEGAVEPVADGPTRRRRIGLGKAASAVRFRQDVRIRPEKPPRAPAAWDDPRRWVAPPALGPRESRFAAGLPAHLAGKRLAEWTMAEVRAAVPYRPTAVRQTGESLLASGGGDCSGMARLFQDLMRHRGLPCRLVGGVILRNGLIEKTHIWNEVFLEGGWVTVCCVNQVLGTLPPNWLVLRFGDTRTLDGPGRILFRAREIRSAGTSRDRPGAAPAAARP